MMKYALLRPLTAALGAAGTAAILFSFFGGGEFLFAGMAFLIVLLGNILLSSLDEKKQFPVLAILFVILLAGMVLFRSALTQSAVSASIPLLQTLSEPYDVEMDIPKPSSVGFRNPCQACTLPLYFLVLPFCFSFESRKSAGRTYFFLYPAPQFLLWAEPRAFRPRPFRCLHHDPSGSPQIEGTGSPGNRRFRGGPPPGPCICPGHPRKPCLAACDFCLGLQEKIVEFVDPYDPVFHAGNAYTGMMKGSA